MRTKALFLTAVLAAAGVATSLAQTVYSLNVVGYINVPVAAGYNTIACQLLATPNNQLGTIMTNVPADTTVFKWNGNGWDSSVYAGDGVWFDSTPTPLVLAPGDGGFVQMAAAGTITFVGDVPQGNQLTVNLTSGFNLISSIVPQSIDLDAMGYPANADNTVYFLRGGAYISYINAGAGVWFPSAAGIPDLPTPNVGEAFWVDRGANPAAVWTRSFVVN